MRAIDKTPNTKRRSRSRVPTDQQSRLMDCAATCNFFGGISVATLYRGIGHIYPRPVKVSNNVVRWVVDECEVALANMIAKDREARDKPRRGRPRLIPAA